MDKCYKCGTDTLLYDDGLPICLKCAEKDDVLRKRQHKERPADQKKSGAGPA